MLLNSVVILISYKRRGPIICMKRNIPLLIFENERKEEIVISDAHAVAVRNIKSAVGAPNKTLNNDCNRRLSLGLGPLPILVFSQLGGKRAITGIAYNPNSLL